MLQRIMKLFVNGFLVKMQNSESKKRGRPALNASNIICSSCDLINSLNILPSTIKINNKNENLISRSKSKFISNVQLTDLPLP